jgi:hypothetical protein
MAAALVVGLIVLGCMSSTESRTVKPPRETIVVRSDPRSYPPGDGLLEQDGQASIVSEGVQKVYYPVPYISPPNLTLEAAQEFCVVTQQAADHFCIHNNSGDVKCFRWRAKGIKLLLETPVMPQAPPAAPPPPGVQQLPPEPVPVEPKP